MQDYGVNLICVEDGIDSSKDSGKLMISVLSAVSEIERDNILVQTMEGRRQKAREGKWNGGMAPYGYCINKGILEIIPEEAEIVKLIYDKYINFDMGSEKIAIFLNENGYWQVGIGDNTPEIEIVFDSQIIADKIVLKENIATGQQIESFGIFADNGKGYKKICSSTVIGAKRICRFKKQKINRLKIVITSYRVKATLNTIEIYCKSK